MTTDRKSYTVSIHRCASYDDETVTRAVSGALAELGGLGSCIRPGSRVLVKVNLLSAHHPDRAVTTHPAVVKAVVEEVRQCGATAVVGDSPGGRNTPQSYRTLLEKTGIQDVIDETGCESVFFDDNVAMVAPPGARTFRRLPIAQAVMDADAVIAVPKLKTHQFTVYTGAVKLLYGYLPGVTKAEYHLHVGQDRERFAELLLDVHACRPPEFAVMDAVVGMEGNGPTHGSPRHVGAILASRSCTALDYAAASLVGIDPGTIPACRLAGERGIGPSSPEEVAFVGNGADLVCAPFALPESQAFAGIPLPLVRVARRLFASRPVIDPASCVRCGRCAENCPPGAIAWTRGSLPAIDARACIGCFCCQELCPAGAVGVRRPLARRLVG